MISLPVLVGAAVIDSLNPCAFGVLIFLLTYLLKSVKRRRRILFHGLIYIFAVFLTYMLAGVLLLPFLNSFGNANLHLYGALGLLVIFLGFLEVKDFFWYGRGPTLALLPGTSARIKFYVRYISGHPFSTFLLGVFVALVELPCTGAVYLAILSLMALSGVGASSLTLLFLYNFIFVFPLIVILFIFHRGLSVKRLEAWRLRYRGLMRLGIGMVLISLGGWMVYVAWS